MTAINPILEVVVTARPSWARVRSLVLAYSKLAGVDKCRISLIGPALSKRYGDISDQIPHGVDLRTFQTLRDSDDLGSIALSSIDGSEVLARHWSSHRPDCVLVIADRTETLGVSSAAALMQIPLIHLQGGEVSGSIDDKIRDANTKLADFHLTTNQRTQNYLVSIGENPSRIRIIGCPSVDLAKKAMEVGAFWKKNEVRGVGADINPEDGYGIIMFHPDTLSEQDNLSWIDCLIDSILSSKLKWFWFWPNPDHGTNAISKKLRHFREQSKLENVKFVINTLPDVFVNLALRAKIMVGNSSFGIRESSFLGLPVINLGNRQRGRQRGENVHDMVDPNSSHLANLIKELSNSRFPSSDIYGSGNAGLLGAEQISQWQPTLKGL